jgi:hypothetical protein
VVVEAPCDHFVSQRAIMSGGSFVPEFKPEEQGGKFVVPCSGDLGLRVQQCSHFPMAAKGTRRPLIHIPSLPDISRAEIDFHDTSFFSSSQLPFPQLPTPASILAQCPDHGANVIKFEHLNLAVKVGDSSYLRLEEAQTMRAIRQAFPHNDVPVPEVFGWRKYEDQTFIYMSLIRGQTLREAWSYLTEEDKESICGELSCVVAALRRITQGSSGLFIGTFLNSCFVALLTNLNSRIH